MYSALLKFWSVLLLAGMLAHGCQPPGRDTAGLLLENWPRETRQALQAVDDRIIETGKDGSAVYYWKSDEYLKSPNPEHLQQKSFAQIMRIANIEYQLALEKLLSRSAFSLCSAVRTAELVKLFRSQECGDWPMVHLWHLEEDIYLLIGDEGGSSGERSYEFAIRRNGRMIGVGDFNYPPDQAQIGEVARRIRAIDAGSKQQ